MTSGYAKLLGAALALVGVEIAQDELVTAIGVFVTIASTIVSLWDRYSKGDVTLLGKRK
jgi:UDP-N-acetylmuramyl pentapeptide phosphotransferase/UDP-N-acetylglucosamine-1-phosphate transferase